MNLLKVKEIFVTVGSPIGRVLTGIYGPVWVEFTNTKNETVKTAVLCAAYIPEKEVKWIDSSKKEKSSDEKSSEETTKIKGKKGSKEDEDYEQEEGEKEDGDETPASKKRKLAAGKNSPSRQSPSRQSPSRQSPSRQSPSRQSPRQSPSRFSLSSVDYPPDTNKVQNACLMGRSCWNLMGFVLDQTNGFLYSPTHTFYR